MNWFAGDITEAVALSKSRNAVFVVYIERTGEGPCKMAKLLDDSRVCDALGTEDFVCVKIEGDSQAYIQFARIYQIVPIPSIFFIGKAGTPLEIATGVLETVDELMTKIAKVLELAGKPPLKAEEKVSAASSKPDIAPPADDNVPSNAAATSSTSVPAASDCGDNATNSSRIPAPAAKADCVENVAPSSTNSTPAPAHAQVQVAVTSSGENATTTLDNSASAAADESRQSLEQSRLERKAKQEKELEARRRQEPTAKQPQTLGWQKEQEIKELQECMKRERLEERLARDRILAQIAADKAERAQKFATDWNKPSTSAAAFARNQMLHTAAPHETRLHFRFANGANNTHTFKCSDTLEVVRAHVSDTLLPGTGITEFTLATTYPKKEFTLEHYKQTLEALQLYPSAVILVIGKEARGASAMIARQGGIINICSMILMSIFRPIFGVLSSAQKWLTGGSGGGGNGGSGSGSGTNRSGNAGQSDAQKRSNPERGVQDDSAKRRNLDRLFSDNNNAGTQPETSREAYRRYVSGNNVHRLQDNRDSDDENATWNGNSTQQQ